MQVADVLVVEVNVNKGAELAVISVEVAAKVWMLGDQPGKGLAYGAALNLHRTLLSGVLPQRGRYVDFDHSLITGCSRMNQRFTRYSYVITLAAEVHPDDVG